MFVRGPSGHDTCGPECPLLAQSRHKLALHMSAFGGKANTKTELMAGLEIVIHFATNSSFAQTPNYVGSDAPQIKSAHLLRSKIVFGCSRLVNDTRGHTTSPGCAGRCRSYRKALW